MSGYEAPNHTQVPNAFLDALMPEITTMGELKVTLAIIRQTFGWHREEKELSLTRLMQLTGLSRQSVSDGVTSAVERGYVLRRIQGKTAVFSLSVKDLDGLEGRPELVKEVDRSLVKGLDPDKERPERKETNRSSSSLNDGDTTNVWEHYVAVMEPRNTALDDETRRLIAAAIKVTSAEECKRAIDGCARSDFHMKRGDHAGNSRKFNKPSDILRGKHGKRTTRESIEMFCGYVEEQKNGDDYDQAAELERDLRALHGE